MLREGAARSSASCKHKEKKMKTLTFLASLLVTVLLSGATALADSDEKHDAGEWLFPGEYESHQAMWMLWPTYENKAGFPSTEAIIDMIHAMSGHAHVNLAVQDAVDET